MGRRARNEEDAERGAEQSDDRLLLIELTMNPPWW